MDKSLNWGNGKRRVLHQLFNPSAEAKPATDREVPAIAEALLESTAHTHTHLEACRVLRFVHGIV